MRIITSILLLSIILFSENGSFFYYSYQRYKIKQEVKKQLSSTIEQGLLELVDLEKNRDEIKWEDEGKEFSLNGFMYDVKRIEVKNGKTFLVCINDQKENELLKKIVNEIQKNQKDKKNNSYKFQLPDFVVVNADAFTPSAKLIQRKFSNFSESAINFSMEILIPPPRFT